ncbi:hypothetical protein M23134_02673 [Microscilla marina ATCC 23134]|uniref:Uncharacterized protein n=1 Tax=Microscilla marina ATCC 23134 TaxID=313606 RepID=A1ZNW5_MICM2|nr:hypothetical protein M23134_02673 [Microscilla marina ATCC 23134]
MLAGRWSAPRGHWQAGELMLSRLFSFIFWPQKPQGEAQAQRKLNEAAGGKCGK